MGKHIKKIPFFEKVSNINIRLQVNYDKKSGDKEKG